MGFLKKAPERVPVEVVQSTHGQTFVMWPSDVTSSGQPLPDLPVAHKHVRSRHWVMADRTVILILPEDPAQVSGPIVRHTYKVVSAKWNPRSKTLVSMVEHPENPDLRFAISTSGVGCACTQGTAGNAGPIDEPYKLVMVNSTTPEFDWFETVTL